MCLPVLKLSSVFECDLGGCVDSSSFAQQQGGHRSVSFLRCQVQRAYSLLGQNLGLRSILQER